MGAFSDAGFMPHGHCYLWDPGLVGLMVGSDGLIALAYFSIPVTLAVYYLRRGHTRYDWVLLMFAAFIMACGTTHLMEIYTLWVPAYWAQGVIKAATAAVSVLTAVLIWPLLPKVLALPSPAQLHEANVRLEREIAQHRAAELRFRRLIESLPNALVIVDERGQITEINSQTTEWFGYTRDELVGQSVDVLVPERLRGRHGAHRGGFMREPSLRPMGTGRELHGLRRDGSEFPVDISLSPIHTDRGMEVIASIRDVTERRRSEMEMRESERRFRLLVESLPNALVIVNGEGRIAEINSQTSKWFGYGRDELIGQPVEMLVPARLRGQHGEYRDGFMRNSSMRPMGTNRDLYGLRRDGSEFPVDISLSPIHTDRGMEVIASIRDVTDRKRADDLLRHSEERFRAMFDHAPLPMAIVGTDARYQRANARYCELFGYKREELEGRAVVDFVPPEGRAAQEAFAAGIARGELPAEPTGMPYRSKDGRAGTVEVTNALVTDATGDTCVLSMLADITERTRAERALRYSEERYRDLVENIPLGVSVHRDPMPLFLNRGFARILGFDSPEEMMAALERSEPGFYHRDADRATRLAMLERRMAGEDLPTPVQWWGVTQSGEEVCVETYHHRVTWDGQPALEMLHVDVTERVRAERALRESEERYRELLETLPVGVLIHQQYAPRYANRAFANLLGFPSAEAFLEAAHTREPGFYIPEHDRERRNEDHRRRMAGEAMPTPIQWCVQAEDGRTVWLESWHHRLIWNGEPAMESLHFDITDRKAAEAEIRATNTALASVNKELESFAYSVSHDLRAPLRAMSGFSHALLEDYADRLDAAGRDYLRRIDNAVGRMRQLIDDLLTLSRINRGEMNSMPIDLSAMADEIARELREQDPARHVEIRIEKGLHSQGDPRLIRVALQNLLSNAWKFTQKTKRPRIEVGTEPNGECATYFVRDNGVGFDMTYADKLFSPFQRLHTEAEFPGTGIGLAIVQRVVSRHGGHIWAESDPGASTVFRFTL